MENKRIRRTRQSRVDYQTLLENLLKYISLVRKESAVCHDEQILQESQMNVTVTIIFLFCFSAFQKRLNRLLFHLGKLLQSTRRSGKCCVRWCQNFNLKQFGHSPVFFRDTDIFYEKYTIFVCNHGTALKLGIYYLTVPPKFYG